MLLVLLCAALSACVSAVFVFGNDHINDTIALHEFFDATRGHNWTSNTNWTLPVSICTWTGVKCSCSTVCRVTELNMEFFNLDGTIPRSFGLLNALVQVDFYSNSLSGTLPESIFPLLGSLGYLDLSFNKFSGTLPAAVASLTSLWYFDVTRNQLTGTIPPEIGNMTWLTEMFGIGTNQFEGTFPAELTNMPLKQFYLHDNRLNGTIPESVAKWGATMRFFYISSNQFTGTLPTFNCNATNLEGLLVDHNMFSGTIAACFNRTNFPSLLMFSIAANQIVSSIPWSSLSTLSTLQYLDLSDNQLHGALGSSIGQLGALNHLDVSSNRLSGTLPEQLRNLTNLNILNVARNQLRGVFNVLTSSFQPPVVNISFNMFGDLLPDCPGFSSSMFSFTNDDVNSVRMRIFDLRNNAFSCPYPIYPSSTLIFRTACLSSWESYRIILIILAIVLGLAALAYGVFARFNKKPNCFRISIFTVRQLLFAFNWLVSSFLLFVDMFSLFKMILSLWAQVDNCQPFNSYPVFVNSIPEYSGMFYADLMSASAQIFKEKTNSTPPTYSTFQSTFTFITEYSQYDMSFLSHAERSFQQSCESIDSCAYAAAPVFQCHMAYPERAPFGDEASRIFLGFVLAAFVIRLAVELFALTLIIVAGWRGKLWKPRVFIDFISNSLFVPALFLMLPTDAHMKPPSSSKFRPPPASAGSNSVAIPSPVHPPISIFQLKFSGIKAGIRSKETFMSNMVYAEPTYENYLWRLVYRGFLKSIPLLCVNFIYVTRIAVLGISPLNALSFINGLINVPILLAQAYRAYLNPPLILRSYKKFPFDSGAQPSVDSDSDFEEERQDNTELNVAPPSDQWSLDADVRIEFATLPPVQVVTEQVSSETPHLA